MHSRIFLTCCVFISFKIACAQYRVHYKNSIYPEVGGSGVAYSINYERLIKGFISVRAGAGGAQRMFASPVLLGLLLGNNAHHLQFMTGVTYVRNKESFDSFGVALRQNEFRGTAFLGYRYQQRGDRLLFHIGYTPFFGDELIHSAGIACGYRFN